ncbi:hypothetical protein K439DRAFT_1614992 [Ramaria rubella]|nr:hypothetical protein K439DRAFT_1614992 [Ramaria rubella]
MNLVIHLWFAARAANYHEPPRFGNTVLFDIVPDDVFDFIALAIIIVTSVWDSILVVTFCSSQFFRKAISCGAVPINLIIKLLIFSLFQLTFTALDMSSVILSQAALHGNQLSIQSLAMLDKLNYPPQDPLFVFFLFGLQRDILQIWFPCIKRRSDTAVTASMAFSTHISVDLGDLESQHSTERPIERRGSKPDVTDLHRMH